MRGRIGCWLSAGLVIIVGHAAAQGHELLYPESLDRPTLATPVEAVHVGNPLFIYFRTLGPPVGPRANWVAVASGEAIVLSRDGKQVLFTGWEDGRTWFQRPQGQKVSLEGNLRFVIDPTGATIIAFAAEPDDKGMRAVSLLGPQGERRWTDRIRGLRWVSASDDGQRFALGTDSFVRVLDSAGASVLPDVKGGSESGALSPGGTWLARGLVEAGQRLLTWVSVRDPQVAPVPFPVQAAGPIEISPARDLAAHIAQREVALFHLDDGGPQLLQRRAVPAGFAWTGAAFDDQGRLALGRIRVDRRVRRDPADANDPLRPGAARLAVDFFPSAAGDPVASEEWDVPLWNHAAPELTFAPDGRCIANTGHSVWGLKPPWTP